MFSDQCSGEVDEIARKYDVEPYLTEGAMQFTDIRKNEKPEQTNGLNHVHYKIFDQGYENGSKDIFGQMVLYNMAYPPEFPIDRFMQPTFYKYVESQQLLVIFWNHF
jgi:hypothetical protein